MRITSNGLCWLATGLTARAADREATVRRRDHGAAFIVGADEPEEQIAAILDDGQAADLVDDQQARPAKKQMRLCSLPSRPPRAKPASVLTVANLNRHCSQPLRRLAKRERIGMETAEVRAHGAIGNKVPIAWINPGSATSSFPERSRETPASAGPETWGGSLPDNRACAPWAGSASWHH